MSQQLHAHPDRPHFWHRDATRMSTSSMTGIATRLALTLIGAGGIIAGALAEWYRPDHLSAVQLPARSFVSPVFRFEPRLITSAGFIMVMLAAVAIVGLAARSGWMTRLAGALSVAAVGMFAVSLKRSGISDLPSAIGWGMWIALAGSIVTVIAGLRGTYMRTAIDDEDIDEPVTALD